MTTSHMTEICKRLEGGGWCSDNIAVTTAGSLSSPSSSSSTLLLFPVVYHPLGLLRPPECSSTRTPAQCRLPSPLTVVIRTAPLSSMPKDEASQVRWVAYENT